MSEVEKLILENGYEDAVYFDNFDYPETIVGFTDDGRVVYDYEKMVEAFVIHEKWTTEEAMEWIDYNMIRSLPYVENAPIIMFPICQ